MKWVMIILIIGWFEVSGPAVESVEFESEKLCKSAVVVTMKRLKQFKARAGYTAYCIPKVESTP